MSVIQIGPLPDAALAAPAQRRSSRRSLFEGKPARNHPGLVGALCSLLLVSCSDASKPVPERPPVILIVIDTLRADHLGMYGYQRPTSPQLDTWAASGRVFENAQATSPWTLPSFASMLTGHLPSRHGATAKFKKSGVRCFALDETLPTVAESLRDSGYRTGAVVNNPFLAPELGLARGFDSYDHDRGSNVDSRRADVMVSRAIQWIDDQEGAPFFLLLHLFDPHVKYDAPAPQRGTFTEGYTSKLSLPMGSVLPIRKGTLSLDDADRDFIRAAYDEELAFVDQELGRLKRELDARGITDEALIILTSDHGEELFDHGGFEHGHAMWQELLHVPFVVWGPGIEAGREAAPICVTDVAATIADFTGTEPITSSAGVSLWPNLARGDRVPERLLVSEQILHGAALHAGLAWPLKLIVDPVTGDSQLFDLAGDPGETVDLGASRPEEMAELKDALSRFLQQATDGRRGQDSVDVDETTLEKLRALGYAR